MAGGFDSLGLLEELVHAVSDLGWTLPTDVQDEAIPLILGGGDVCVSSETGSGKTAAFCLPMLQCVYETLRDARSSTSKRKLDGAGGSLSIVPVRLSVQDRDTACEVTSDGLACSTQGQGQKWCGVRSTYGAKSGRMYFEVRVKGTSDGSGIVRVGVSTMSAHLELGKDAQGFGYGGTAMKSHANSFTPYGRKYGEGNVVGCLLDLVGKTLSFTVDGETQGVAFELPQDMQSAVFFPALSLKNCSVDVNFGQMPFSSLLPEGFRGFCQGILGEDIVSADEEECFQQNSGPRKPLAIIMEPVIDLAEQVHQNLDEFLRYIETPKISTQLIVSGINEKVVKQELLRGTDIIVGTPGKLQDFLDKGILDLSRVRFFIIDEADRIVDSIGVAAFMKIFAAVPAGGAGVNRLQVCFFSATLHSPSVRELSAKICVNPTWVDLKGANAIPDTVHHVVYRLDFARDCELMRRAKVPSIVGNVHVPGKIPPEELSSQQVKELKQQILVGILDSFKVCTIAKNRYVTSLD
jgi:ATP-dependent RNA helicase DDX1